MKSKRNKFLQLSQETLRTEPKSITSVFSSARLDRFDSGTKYNSKTRKGDTVILNKTQELTHFLLGKSDSIDFVRPDSGLGTSGSPKLRLRIPLPILRQRDSAKHGMRKHL